MVRSVDSSAQKERTRKAPQRQVKRREKINLDEEAEVLSTVTQARIKMATLCVPRGCTLHTVQGRISALSGTHKHVCAGTHAEKLSSHVKRTVLHLQHVHRLYAYYPWRTDMAVKH